MATNYRAQQTPRTLIAKVAVYDRANGAWPMPHEPFSGAIVPAPPEGGRLVAEFFVSLLPNERGDWEFTLPPDIPLSHAFTIVGLFARSDAGLAESPLP